MHFPLHFNFPTIDLHANRELANDGFILATLLVLGTLFAVAPIIAGFLLAPRETSPTMNAIYECGMPAFGRAREAHFGVFYYLYALIFIVFEVDVLYLFPIARIYREGVGLTGFLEILFFVIVLFLAVIFAWKKGVLQWEREALSLR
ncbi:MAG TPA: NADH-quinone oxidoreductase subunit A [Thermodesulfobacteriaceae bacterium]|nr:NADH-quinone oxidoreductase subunit A [Thermodesulfobacteriaceae bacterium]